MFKDTAGKGIYASLKMYPVPGNNGDNYWINTQTKKIISIKLGLHNVAEGTAQEIFGWMIDNGFGASTKDTYIAEVELAQLCVKQKILLEKFNLTL